MKPVMNRREALKQVALLMGGSLSAPAILGVLNGCSAKPGPQWEPVFFTKPQGAVIAEVAEIMIPRTDTPGAIDAGVPAFIDTILKATFAKKDQDRFIAGLAAFETQAQSEHGSAFLKLEPRERKALVQKVHDAAVAEEKATSFRPSKLDRPFILMQKELTLLGFFTSEAGATQVLQYLRIPGALHACIPRAQAGNGKTWAVETSQLF